MIIQNFRSIMFTEEGYAYIHRLWVTMIILDIQRTPKSEYRI
jgi:hypothetical protein